MNENIDLLADELLKNITQLTDSGDFNHEFHDDHTSLLDIYPRTDDEIVKSLIEFLQTKDQINMCRYCLISSRDHSLETFVYLRDDYKNLICNVNYNIAGIPNVICSKCERFLIDYIELCKTTLRSETLVLTALTQINENAKLLAPVLIPEINVENIVEPEYDANTFDSHFLDDSISLINEKTEIIEIPKKIVPNSNTTKPIIKVKKQEKGIYVCDLCDATFAIKDYIVTHMKRKHMTSDYQCPECNKTFTKHKLQVHMRNAHNPKHICEICAKSFPQPFPLKMHMKRKHLKEGEFVCQTCYSDFATNACLLKHIKKEHDEESTISFSICDACGKEFVTEYALMSHRLYVHGENAQTGEQCRICNQRYRNSKELKIHYNRTHVHPCDICSRKFNSIAQLEDHKKQHATEHRPFGCRTCGRRYANQGQLRAHEHRAHSGSLSFECQLCHKPFLTAWALRNHERTHEDGPKISCPICEKPFKDRTTIRKHLIRGHTKCHYACPICQKQYKLTNQFTRHMDTHHPGYLDHNKSVKSCYYEDKTMKTYVLELLSKINEGNDYE